MPRSLDTALFLLAVTVAVGGFLWLSNVSPADWDHLLTALAPPDTVQSDDDAEAAGASSRSQDGPRRAPWAAEGERTSAGGLLRGDALGGDALGGDALALRTRSRRPSVPLPDPGPAPALVLPPAPHEGTVRRPAPAFPVRPRLVDRRSVAPSAYATPPRPAVHRDRPTPWRQELERLGGELNRIGTQVAALRRDARRDHGMAPQAPNNAASSGERAETADTAPLPGTDPDPVPVDGGLGLLLVAGAAYGLRRLQRS